MSPTNDDLLTALRSARPDPGFHPSSHAPEAGAMLAGILDGSRGPGSRRRPVGWRMSRFRLVLAGLPALAAAVAVVVAVATAPSGTPSGQLSAAAVRAAVLDAFQQDSGDILLVTGQDQGDFTTSSSDWVYPAFPAVGQQVRLRELTYINGKPAEDVESIYTEDAALEHISMSTTQGPPSAKVFEVDYQARTWATYTTTTPLVDLTISPALIRSQVASGDFTVDGKTALNGRDTVKLSFTAKVGPAATRHTTLWVDANTYVPLRSVSTIEAGASVSASGAGAAATTITLNYQMIPATAVGLKVLTPPVPAGFAHVARVSG
jgi:hypothetical protein